MRTSPWNSPRLNGIKYDGANRFPTIFVHLPLWGFFPPLNQKPLTHPLHPPPHPNNPSFLPPPRLSLGGCGGTGDGHLFGSILWEKLEIPWMNQWGEREGHRHLSRERGCGGIASPGGPRVGKETPNPPLTPSPIQKESALRPRAPFCP